MHFHPTGVRKFSTSKKRRFRFQFFAPQARRVYLGGNFNPLHSKFTPMIKGKNGLWHAFVILLPGHYEYNFYVDGMEGKGMDFVEPASNKPHLLNPIIEVA